MLFVSPFFREFIPKKEVFKFTTPICSCSPSNLCCHLLHATILCILYSKTLGIWIQGSRAAGHVLLLTYFSNLLKDKDRRLKIKLTLSLILRVNLRLGGLLHMECEFNRTPYKEDLITTRSLSTSEPRHSQGSTRRAWR
jgi:hypothetical protein